MCVKCHPLQTTGPRARGRATEHITSNAPQGGAPASPWIKHRKHRNASHHVKPPPNNTGNNRNRKAPPRGTSRKSPRGTETQCGQRSQTKGTTTTQSAPQTPSHIGSYLKGTGPHFSTCGYWRLEVCKILLVFTLCAHEQRPRGTLLHEGPYTYEQRPSGSLRLQMAAPTSNAPEGPCSCK